MAFLTKDQIDKIGFSSIGNNCLISERAVFYNPSKIEIGNNSRIDDFCILSAGDNGIYIGNYVHISCFVTMIGAGKIYIGDYCAISVKCTLFSSTDDFSGAYYHNPQLDSELRNVKSEPIIIEENTVIGACSVILPNVIIGFNCAIGAMSFIKKDIPPNEIWVGNPARKIKERKQISFKMSNYG
jgi:galactoside O-acetyltransferase